METIPYVKKQTLIERLVIPVDREMKREIGRLKDENGINMTEWIRQVLRRELLNLKNNL